MNPSGDRLGVVSVEYEKGIWVTKVTVIRIGNRISQSSATVTGALGSTCGFVSEDRFAVVFTDRVMVVNSDATVTGEKHFGSATPTLAAIGRGSVAILTEDQSDLTRSTLTVYDRNAKESYSLAMDTDHPITKAGNPTALAMADNALFLHAGKTLFRLTNNGNTVTAATVSHDTLAVLPESGDEVLICTPAYAYRVSAEDFVRP
jgi:hypothetical protein